MKDLLEPIKTVCFIFFFDLCLRLKCSAIIFTVSLKSRLFALFSCRWQGSQGEAGAPGSKGSKVSAAMFSFKSAEHSVLISSLPLMRFFAGDPDLGFPPFEVSCCFSHFCMKNSERV